MNLRYAVIGTGAIGGYYGAKLARSGQEVHFLLRSDYAHVKANGLAVSSVNGDFVLEDVLAYHSTADMPVCDVVIVGLKTTANAQLAGMLKPIVHKHTLVVLIQNGYGIEAQLAEELPGIAIAGGLAFICSQKISPGHITHLDLGHVNLGLYCGEKDCLVQVVSDLEAAGVAAHLSSDLERSRWEKLVWNIPFNGLSVVMNASTDLLVRHTAMRTLLKGIMDEVIAAATCCGYPIESVYAQRMIELTQEMTPYAPSMKLDYDQRRPLELQAMYWSPIETARRAGCEMPQTRMLACQLQFMSDYNGGAH